MAAELEAVDEPGTPDAREEAQLEADDAVLDQEAEALLSDLADSQAEVARMLAMQRDQANELGGLKDQLAAE
ncbi:uncharacterized protein HaLaN_33189, partial [Haematococcus lacustris]